MPENPSNEMQPNEGGRDEEARALGLPKSFPVGFEANTHRYITVYEDGTVKTADRDRRLFETKEEIMTAIDNASERLRFEIEAAERVVLRLREEQKVKQPEIALVRKFLEKYGKAALNRPPSF